jgi:hypothetical protein
MQKVGLHHSEILASRFPNRDAAQPNAGSGVSEIGVGVRPPTNDAGTWDAFL